MERFDGSPLDYIEYLKILHDAPSDIEIKEIAESFLLMCDISMANIRNEIYRYVSLDGDYCLNNKKFDTLLNKQIHVAFPGELNDPFDCEGFFCDMEEVNKRLSPYVKEIRLFEERLKNVKIGALTTNGVSSTSMWTNYANHHTGFCISYNISKFVNPHLYIGSLPVQYVEKRFDLTDVMIRCFATSIMLAEQHKDTTMFNNPVLPFIMKFLYCMKDISWNYENEVRCLLHGVKEEDQYIPASPSKIFIGMYCLRGNAEKLFHISKTLGVPVYLMTKATKNSPDFLIAKEIGSVGDLDMFPKIL